MKLLFKSLILFALVLSFQSCGDDETPEPEPNPETITEIAAADPQFSTLVGALSRVGLDATLNGAGTFTVFAPTNAAFTAAGINLDDLTDAELTNVLLYHVLGAEVASTSIAAGKSYASTLNETGPGSAALSIFIENNNGVRINNRANVTTADVEATNGVIHIVDAVLLPMDVVEHALANSDFNTLTGALGDASGDLVNVLKGAGPFTVFAPNNEGFAGLGDLSTVSADELRDILTYHVIGGAAIKAGDIDEGDTYASTASTSGPGGAALSLLIQKSGNSVSINNASNVILTDVVGTNGIIHAVSAAYMPLDVVGHASANASFSELVSALGAADGDLVGVLSGTGPFTVFAPVNSAFEEIADVVSGLSTSELEGVLTYHVASGNVRSTDLSNGQTVNTVNGETFTINLGTEVTITDASGGTSTVVLTDVQGTNGVIHVLDTVILP